MVQGADLSHEDIRVSESGLDIRVVKYCKGESKMGPITNKVFKKGLDYSYRKGKEVKYFIVSKQIYMALVVESTGREASFPVGPFFTKDTLEMTLGGCLVIILDGAPVDFIGIGRQGHRRK